MSGGGGAAGPRLYGYGSALPPAALLRRGLAQAASGLGSAAVGATAAGAAPLLSLRSFSPAEGCASAQVPRPPFLRLESAAAARTADRNGRGTIGRCEPRVPRFGLFSF